MRDAIVLGVAVPFALGAVHLLTGPACFLVVSALAVLRLTRTRPARLAPVELPSQTRGFELRLGRTLPVLVTLAVGWPALVRPLLQGDSLGYHLPNAAAWVTSGSLWTTSTHPWWYPGGSELFAAGLFAVAGPLAVGFAGTAAALLAGQRLLCWGVAFGARPWVAGALSAATLGSFVFAQQAGNLQNDLWLGAFFLEALWAGRSERPALTRAAALCALVKPSGFLYALAALVAVRARWRVVLVALAPLAFWFAHDALLWRTAIIPPASTAYRNTAATTILAHGLEGFATLGAALTRDGWWTALLFAFGFVALVVPRDPPLRLAATTSLLLFLATPFGFDNPLPQLAMGDSLRYAIPFLLVGAVALAGNLRRLAPLAGTLGLVAAALGVAHIRAIFWNDTTTHDTFLVVALVGLALLALPGRLASLVPSLLALALVTYAVRLAGSHPIDYYNDLLSRPGARSGLFTWVAEHEPSAIVGWRLRIGSIVVVSPTTRAVDALESDPCDEARRLHALLIAADDPQSTPPEWGARRDRALDCGPAIYRDATALVIAPR